MPDRPEIWGGIECTVVRIHDRFRDQVVETGHRERPDDLDLVASLGLRTLRYPILWETVSPDRPDRADFGWHDRRLTRLRELGIEPVAGLVHHGSGPAYTGLLDPAFPRLLARHAARAARRYPWIRRWTPVNEPLTTARFSALYGHWYPHRRSEHDFLRALAIQCRGILLAMRAIRRVVPDAELVQTEDLGRIFSTPALAHQAAYENERRWLSLDLLCGRVDRSHPWRRRFEEAGIPSRHLDAFRSGEARPDILGINHYLTSDRYLDERLDRYPSALAGGNGRDRYADAEAVRVPALDGETGPAPRLREAWSRYGIPLALTEIHHGSSRDEQLRWLAACVGAANALRREGVDIRAVTAWSMFGTVDWNSLLTREIGLYEPGVFDARGPEPRPTALAAAVRSLAASGRFDHPVLDGPGWWRRPERAYAGQPGARPPERPARPARRLVAIGPDGPVLRAYLRVAAERGLVCDAVARPPDAAGLQALRAWAMLVVAQPDGSGLAEAAQAAAAAGLPLLAVRAGPTLSPPASSGSDALFVDIGEPFGPWDDDSVSALAARLLAGRPVMAGGEPVAPAYLPDLVHVSLDLLIDGERGHHRLENGRATWAELAATLAVRMGLVDDTGPETSGHVPPPSGIATMPPLASALERWVAARGLDRRPGAFPLAAE